MLKHDTTSVVICGGGPTGVVLSALLNQLQVPNIVLEREAGVTTDPRGIALDEDGIRVLQAVGVYDRIFTEIGQCMEKFHFISGTGTDLSKPPLISMDQSTSEGGTGHVGFICHKQPVLEQAVRDVIAKSHYSELRTQSTVTDIDEDSKHVYVTYADAEGRSRRVTASFLVGADGKTGYVRKKYLEPKGILMERCEGTNYEETWVALNWKLSLPTVETHPEFPLWRLGYTPEQVYDEFFPREFRFLCNPKRPAVCGRFGRPEDRLWRFEFVVQKDEDGMHMSTFEETKKIIFPYLTHPGSRYGLKEDVMYPFDCITTLRSRPFTFSARSCNKWALGRVAIAGDAAHVFPPFGGQGIASGFRDALGLAWRLAFLHRQPDADHEQFLSAWYLERKQQLERSLAATIRNGEYVNEGNPAKLFFREWYLYFTQLVPSWKREIEKGQRAGGMVRYEYQKGMPFMRDMLGGLLLPQVYVTMLPKVQVAFSDDLIFGSSKSELIQLLLLPESTSETSTLMETVAKATKKTSYSALVQESTVIIQDTRSTGTMEGDFPGERVVRLATAEEFAADSKLCRDRPPPIYYDPYRLRKELKGRKIVLVRPDRFVYAACSDVRELEEALNSLHFSLNAGV